MEDGGSTALYAAYTVDAVYTVDTVDIVYTVYTVDTEEFVWWMDGWDRWVTTLRLLRLSRV